jgi:hypothetical protein
MLNKLLLRDGSVIQFIFAFTGATAGMLLLLASIQLFLDFSAYLEIEKDIIGSDYIVINKRIGVLSPKGSAALAFSPDEISTIESQTFVEKAVPFESSAFEVSAGFNTMYSNRYFTTEMFFEALPDEYLDLNKELWQWSPGDSIVPIALPKDYLTLYNFGFAQSQGLPQVSSGMASMITFSLSIKGSGRVVPLKARIAGFTERINTILAPFSFVRWANKELSGNTPNPTRLLLVTPNPSSPELANFLESNHYETNREKLKTSKLNLILQTILGIVAAVALLIIVLAFFVFALGFQLMIARSINRIRLLLHLGFGYMRLAARYIVYFLIILVGINLLTFIIISISKPMLMHVLQRFGIAIDSGVSLMIYITAFLLSLLLFSINSILITLQIKKAAQ